MCAMIENINISNYALIERSELQLGKGFSVITGETGAGKSILLGALNLALGARADSSVVRDKGGKCIVEVTFDVSEYGLEEWFKVNELDYDEHTVVRRQVSSEGKSRSFINDTPVTIKQLKEFGSYLIDIHSQHESLLLGKSDFQAELLDAFCGNGELLERYSELYKERNSLVKELDAAKEEWFKAQGESDFLNYRFNMLSAANLRVGEALELEEELAILQNSEQIKGALGELVYSLRDDDSNMLSQLNSLRGSMDKICSVFPVADEYGKRLRSVYLELSDMADEAERKGQDVDCDGGRLQAVEERLGVLYDLQLKFKVDTPDELVNERNAIEERLSQIEVSGDLVQKLTKQIEQCEASLIKIADELHASRVAGVDSLIGLMVELLQSLGIAHPQLKVVVEREERFMANGCDKIAILFAANKNQVPGEIANIASGGEMSRVMLAFKYVLAKCKKLPVVIFDEIDTGVSGQVAHKMAAMLREMSNFMQVIAISHLPQIASAGEWHYKVYKEDSEQETLSKIKLLTKAERIEELAVMMSGNCITAEALSAAEKLLNGE